MNEFSYGHGYTDGAFDECNRIAEWLEDTLADDYIAIFGAGGNTTVMTKQDLIAAIKVGKVGR